MASFSANNQPITTIPVARFALNAITIKDPFGAFRDLVMPSMETIYETAPLEPFNLSAAAATLGQVGLAFVRASAQRWDRTPALTRRNETDHIVVNVRFSGGALGEADGREMTARSGEIMIHDLSRPQVHDSDRSHTAALVLPRAVAQSLVPDTRALHGLIIPAGPASLLLNYLRELEPRIDSLPASTAGSVGSAALNLLSVALAQVSPTHPIAPSATAIAARRRVEQIIDERLGSASLSVTNLARWARVSRSTLYRLFEADGGVQNVIRDRRLARVAAELHGPDATVRIADIAERWGFCDAAYLGRVFREVHGMTPGEYRAGASER